MVMHLTAYTETKDNVTDDPVAAVQDNVLTTTGDDIFVSSLMPNLAAVYGLLNNGTELQITSPSIRRIGDLNIVPYDSGTEPASNPNLHHFFDNPLALEAGEEINALVDYPDVATAERVFALVWFSDAPVTPVAAGTRIQTVHATSSTTLTANSWTTGSIVFDKNLPAGRYAVVGMRVQSAGLIAARLNVVGATGRMGVIGFDADTDIEPAIFRNGRLGVWGEFEHSSPPFIDFLSISADTSEDVWLDLVQVRAGVAT